MADQSYDPTINISDRDDNFKAALDPLATANGDQTISAALDPLTQTPANPEDDTLSPRAALAPIIDISSDKPTFTGLSHSLVNGVKSRHHEEVQAIIANKPADTRIIDGEVEDLGWKTHPADMPSPLIKRLSNEELWLLIRRFNKQLYHVKAITPPLPGNLDLVIATDEEFSPDKLRSNIERLYLTVIIGLVGFGKHIARLRSWHETKRTLGFCFTYYLFWAVNLTLSILIALVILLMTVPKSRSWLFPPTPIAAVSGSTGDMQLPRSGVLATGDTLTGAPEVHKGEAAEKEAGNFVNGFAQIAVGSVVGKHPGTTEEQESELSGKGKETLPDPTRAISDLASVKSMVNAGDADVEKVDKTKQPVEDAMWEKARPVMRAIADISDGWERWANAFSPKPPFHQNRARLQIASALLPMLLLALIIPPSLMWRGITFIMGLAFFGQPLITNGIHYLNTNYPNWPKYLELRGTLLKGVPTNAQLMITLLRIGELQQAPIPPAPNSNEEVPDEDHTHDDELVGQLPDDGEGRDLDDLADDDDDDSTGSYDDVTLRDVHDTEDSRDKPLPKKPTKRHRLANALKSTLKGSTRAAVDATVKVDRVKAAMGLESAKQRIGALPKAQDREAEEDGPVGWEARWRGTKGFVWVSVKAGVPVVAFSKGLNLKANVHTHTDGESVRDHVEGDSGEPIWSVPIAEISELRKIGGLGWKGKLVVGWALGMEVADGLEIVTKSKGMKHGQGHDGEGGVEEGRWVVTALRRRDELFNRLVAVGGQKWEAR